MHLIWSKGFSEIQIYKTANIDRRLFSKIRSDADYHPQKQTILSLIIALHLNLVEAEDLLSRAGFAFSPVNTIDSIYQFCIENSIYDVIFQQYQFSSADILDAERITAGKYFSFGGEQLYEDLDSSIKAECLVAAKEALDGVDPTREATGGGAFFFYNPECCSEEQLALRANIPYDNVIIIEDHWFHREWPAV